METGHSQVWEGLLKPNLSLKEEREGWKDPEQLELINTDHIRQSVQTEVVSLDVPKQRGDDMFLLQN